MNTIKYVTTLAVLTALAGPAAATECDFTIDCDVKAIIEQIKEKNPVPPANSAQGARYRLTIPGSGKSFNLEYVDRDKNAQISPGDSLDVEVVNSHDPLYQSFRDEGLDGFVLPFNQGHQRHRSEFAAGVPVSGSKSFQDTWGPADWYKVEGAYRTVLREIGTLLLAKKK